MSKLLAEDGPVVKCVMLRVSGLVEQLDVNMSPKLRKTQEVLGGEVTFLGQWEDLEVILMVSVLVVHLLVWNIVHRLCSQAVNTISFMQLKLYITYDSISR